MDGLFTMKSMKKKGLKLVSTNRKCYGSTISKRPREESVKRIRPFVAKPELHLVSISAFILSFETPENGAIT